jgi:tetratricopeptide (TPR) repeat protein
MTRSTHVSQGHLALIPFLAATLALAACGGEDTPSRIAEAEAAVTVAPVTGGSPTRVERTTPATDLPREVTSSSAFGTPEEAYRAGDYRVATRMYRSQLETTPDDGHGHYMLGLSSWKAGDFANARTAFDRAIELNPGFAKAYFNQGRVLLDLGRAPEALEVIEKGRTIDSTSGEGLRLVARAKAEGGDIDGAIATYRDLLVRDEDDAWGLNNLGMLLLARGDVDGALGPLARAVQVRPTAPLFLNNLGMALERKGYTVAALRRYGMAVQHDSTHRKAIANVERLKGIVAGDSTQVAQGAQVDEVRVHELAEGFRQTVRRWKSEVSVVTPVPPVSVVPELKEVPMVVITP